MIRLDEKKSFWILAFLGLTVSLLFAACGSDQPNARVANNANQSVKAPASNEAKTNSMKSESNSTKTDANAIVIEGYEFTPAEMTVAVGTKITWHNKDDVEHSVTSDTKVFDSGIFGKDKEFSYVFDKAGTFPYHCTPHSQMKATIIVK